MLQVFEQHKPSFLVSGKSSINTFPYHSHPTSVLEIQVYKHHHAQNNNTDARIAHGCVYIVSASAKCHSRDNILISHICIVSMSLHFLIKCEHWP